MRAEGPAQTRHRKERMSRCVLLNADYTFLNLLSWKRAVCLTVKGKVQVLKYSERIVRTVSGGEIRIPAVLKLIKLIRTLYRSRVTFSKRNVLVRDRFRCAYCGEKRARLTIDHIIPRSRGGSTDFENCVACCRACNIRKGSRTPREALMFPRVKAYQPTISEFLALKLETLGLHSILREIGIF
jgi:5-methylcytosine-specific restriction endonuclease McrA